MGDVERSLRRHITVVDPDDAHVLVALDLTHGDPHEVVDGDGVALAALRVEPGEHEKALRVPTHAAREVIDPVEILEAVGVFLGRLESVDVEQLPLEEALVATDQVDHEIAHAFSDLRALLERCVAALGLHGVQRLNDQPETLVGRAREVVEAREVVVIEQGAGEAREPVGRQLCGGGHHLVDLIVLRRDLGAGDQRARRDPEQREHGDGGGDLAGAGHGEDEGGDGGDR